MKKVISLMVVIGVCSTAAFSMSASLAVSADISKVIETNADQSIHFNPQHCYEQGYITGISNLSGDPSVSVDPVSEIRFENISGEPIRLDGIFLNKAGFVFNYAGFKHKYNIKDKLHLDQMQHIFWDTYACVHHAQPSGSYYKASKYDMARIWNVFGYGLCYWTNQAMGDFLNYAGVDIRQASAYGHFLKEYWIDDKWVLFDFNQKGYYRTLDGEVAGQDEIFDDPYIVFAQNTFGPLEAKRLIIEAAVRVQCPPSILTKQARKNMKTQRPLYSEAKDYDPAQKYTGVESVMMAPGDAISFTNLSARNNVLDSAENIWGRANMFARKGSFILETIPVLPADKKYEIKKKLPFVVDEVEISFDADNFDGSVSHIVVRSVNPNQSLAYIRDSRSRSGTKVYFKASLYKPTDNIHLVFDPVVAQGENPSFKNLEVKLNFFYNSRMLWDIKPDSNLHLLADKNAAIKTTIRANPDYKNSFYDAKESCSVKSKDSHIDIDIHSHKQPQYYEYYLAKKNTDYPVATGWYFVDKTGQRTMPLECLPSDKYKVYFRCYYPSADGLGYWSKWKTSDQFHIDNTKKDIALKFSQSNGKLYAALVDVSSEDVEIIISENKFFPVRDGQPFMGKSGEPLGNELSDNPPAHYAKIKKDKPFEWPKWGCYYRIVKNGQVVSKLQHTQSVLSDQGFANPDVLVDAGLTIVIDYIRTQTGHQHYTWDVVDSFTADKITAVISKEGEFGYKTKLPYLVNHLVDTKSEPQKSTLQLFEDGKPLPLPHSKHEDIAKTGAGRYSCYQDNGKWWVRGLQFSTSDNTDPVLNGRKYEFRSKDLQHSVEVVFKYAE